MDIFADIGKSTFKILIDTTLLLNLNVLDYVTSSHLIVYIGFCERSNVEEDQRLQNELVNFSSTFG